MEMSANLPARPSAEVQQAKQRLGIVGNSPALSAAVARAMRVAPIDLSVLITGESGTGKEFFPKIIHNYSSRKHAKYIAVNCGAIPEGTIDSELFGHEKGSFTGAVASRKGYFEEADGGTIFLDEVAELPLTTQARLLRVLESGEFLKVGSSTVQRTNIRVVAATNVMMDMGAEILTQKIDDTVPLVGTVADGDLLPIANINMGNIQGGFDTFIMPGIVVLILQQCIILVIGMAGGAKRERRTLVRYDADNYEPSIFGTMCAQMLAYITILILPAVFMIHYVPLIFSFPIAGNMFEEMAFLLPMVIACFGLGFAFQGLVTERESVFVCWVITSVVFLFLSGMIWPRYDMAPVWKALSDICPSTWGVEGFIKMSSNGSSLAQVSHEYLMLWILAAAWWAAGWVVQLTAVRPAMLRQQARNIIIFNRLMRSGYFGGKKIQNDRTDNRQ